MRLLEHVARSVREKLEPAFGPETSNSGVEGLTPSAGHCAAAAWILKEMLGGEFASATVKGESHWFARIGEGTDSYDVDITGDQFGYPAVQVKPAGELYEGTRTRKTEDCSAETIERAKRLAEKAGLGLGANQSKAPRKSPKI